MQKLQRKTPMFVVFYFEKQKLKSKECFLSIFFLLLKFKMHGSSLL